MGILKTSKDYFPAIDGLRAVAIMAVVLFHLELSWFQGGYLGVDVFFVISGYLISRNIAHALDDNHFSLISFYLARFRRLFPALIVTVALTLLAGALLFSPHALVRLSGSAIASVLSLANIRYWQSSGYFDIDHLFKPLLHFWSLSVEEQFYLIWPILLIGIVRLSNRKKTALWLLGLIFVLSLISSQVVLGISPETAFYWMPFRAFEFALGTFLVVVERSPINSFNKSYQHSAGVTFIGLALIIVCSVIYSSTTPIPGFSALPPTLGAALVIASKESILAKLFLSNKIVTWLGRISYSLYLVHWPIWVYTTFLLVRDLSPIEKTAVFALMLAVAAMLHYLVEKRFRHTPKSTKRIAVSSYVFVALGIFILGGSWLIRSQQGLPQRMSGNYAELMNRSIECQDLDKADGRRCKLGEQDENKKPILVIGDSHSMNLRYGLTGFASDKKYSFHSISVAGCPPLIDVEVRYSVRGKIDSRCEQFSELLKREVSHGQYHAVILSARWMWFYEHHSYSNDAASRKIYLSAQGKLSNSALDSRDAWHTSLISTVNFIKQHGSKVVVISQYPLLHTGIGECNKSPILLIPKARHVARCEVKIQYQEIMDRLAFTNKAILKLSDAQVLSIVPSDYFCSDLDQQCRVLTQRGLLYADENHLSKLGGEYLVQSIANRLDAFLKTQ